MKHFFYMAVIYVLVQNGGQTGKLSYEGMDQQSADTLLAGIAAERSGMTYQFVDKKTFDAAPNPVSAKPVPDPVKVQAVLDAKDTTKTPQARLDALIKAIDLK